MTRIKDTGKTQPKIRHTGKSEPLIDVKKVAEALGADDVISSQKQSRNSHDYHDYIVGPFIVTKGGCETRRRVYELDEEGVKKYALLKKAEGEDFQRCVDLGATKVNNFWKRVCGYRIDCVKDQGMVVSFYEKK